MSLVDILMPVRNATPFLAEAVESIIEQTFTDWRLIAVDDHSCDDTWMMLRAWSKADDRIRPLKNEGSGMVRALDTALGHSWAPFLARMDSDDISEPSRLEKLVYLMDSDPSASVAGSRVAVFPPDVVSPNMKRYIKWQNSLLAPDQIRQERYVESTLTHGASIFRRDVLVQAGGWREGPFPEDLDLWLRLHRDNVKFVKHPEALYLWREHGLRETRNSARCTHEAFHRCKVTHITEDLKDRDINGLSILGPDRARRRWARSMAQKGFKVQSLGWKPGEPVPRTTASTDFTLAAFGVPSVRNRAREQLAGLGDEEERWLFVG